MAADNSVPNGYLGPPERAWMPIRGPKPGVEVCGIVTNPGLVICQLHYLDNPARPGRRQSMPHVKLPDGCYGCINVMPKRWKGYLGCTDVSGGKPFIAEVTADAARSCQALTTKGFNLRGRFLRLRRMGKQRNSSVFACLETPLPVPALQDPIDVVGQLLRLWGYPEDTWAAVRPSLDVFDASELVSQLEVKP